VRRAKITNAKGDIVTEVDVAETRGDRRKGLLGCTVVETPMWFPKTRSVHTVGMQTTIDVAHVTKAGVVLSVRTMPVGKIGLPNFKAHAILETAAGQCAQLGIRVGETLVVT
jgi:uncharacterized protein